MNHLLDTHREIREALDVELRAAIMECAKISSASDINTTNMESVLCAMLDWYQALLWYLGHVTELMCCCGIDRELLSRIELGEVAIGSAAFFDEACDLPPAALLGVDISSAYLQHAQVIHQKMLERTGITGPFCCADTTLEMLDPLTALFQVLSDLTGWTIGALSAMGTSHQLLQKLAVLRRQEGADEFTRISIPHPPRAEMH